MYATNSPIPFFRPILQIKISDKVWVNVSDIQCHLCCVQRWLVSNEWQGEMLAINYGKFDILSNHTIPYHIISQHITTSHILTLTSYPSFGKAKLSIFWESAYQFKHRVYYIHSTTNRTFVLEVQIQPYEHMIRISERQSD